MNIDLILIDFQYAFGPALDVKYIYISGRNSSNFECLSFSASSVRKIPRSAIILRYRLRGLPRLIP